jgi:hypothetical protein
MRRTYSGIILLDNIDIACIAFSMGCTLAYFYKKYNQKTKHIDPIIQELKETTKVVAVCIDGTPFKVPVCRGGDEIRGISLIIRNKKLSALVLKIVAARKNYRLIRFLQMYFAILNSILTNTLGIRVCLGGSMNYFQVVIIALPVTLTGFMISQIINPLTCLVLPLSILYGRGIEQMSDPFEECRMLCKAVSELHNKQLAIEMRKTTSNFIKLPVDEGPLLCVENKLSLSERFVLRSLVKNEKIERRIQHFSDFIKKFPKCDVDPQDVYDHIIEKTLE